MKLDDILVGMTEWSNLAADVTSVGTLRAEAHKRLRTLLESTDTSAGEMKEVEIPDSSSGLRRLALQIADDILDEQYGEAADSLASLLLLGIASDMNRYIKETQKIASKEDGLASQVKLEVLSVYTMTRAMIEVALSLFFMVQFGWPVLNYSLQNAAKGGLLEEDAVEYINRSMAEAVVKHVREKRKELEDIQMKQNTKVIDKLLEAYRRKAQEDNHDYDFGI